MPPLPESESESESSPLKHLVMQSNNYRSYPVEIQSSQNSMNLKGGPIKTILQENPSVLAGKPNLSALADLASHFSLAGSGPTSVMALQEQQVI